MATLRNQKYALITSQSEIVHVKKMGVSEQNIVPYNQCQQLLQKMSRGDVICVASVRCFATGVYDFWMKMQWLSNQGIEFQSAQEKYLNFSTLKPLSPMTLDSIRILAGHEYEFLQMIQNWRLPDNGKRTLLQRISSEFMTCLCVMFRNNGIRKQGS